MRSFKEQTALAWRLSASVLVVSLSGCGADGSDVQLTPTAANNGTTISDAPASRSIEVLSSRPDSVSGGDALIQVKLPPGIGKQGFTVTADGRDVSSHFEETGKGTYVGLITGLTVGTNTIEVVPKNGKGLIGSIQVTNYPITGPIFSGPHETPFYCET
jgi:hypothetical protein